MNASVRCNDTQLGQAIGQTFDSQLYFAASSCGNGVFTQLDLPSGTRLVSCLYEQAITPESCRKFLSVFGTSYAGSLTHRQAMATMLALYTCQAQARHNLVAAGCSFSPVHEAYVASLPEQILTPLSFNSNEKALLLHTNLAGATQDRENEWRTDHETVKQGLPFQSEETEQLLPFSNYLWACSIISSRAFPSSLIGNDEVNSHPILFPGVDTLNHSPPSKMLWLKEADRLTLITEQPISAGKQCFNNYGPKSNEELLLGYGFVIPDNPADLLAVKLGKPRLPSTTSVSQSNQDDPTQLFTHLGINTERHIILRDGVLPISLLAQMRFYLADAEEKTLIAQRAATSCSVEEVCGFISWDNELDMLDQLGSMLKLKAQGLEAEILDSDDLHEGRKRMKFGEGEVLASQGGIMRQEVRQMILIYRQGVSFL